MKKRSQIPTKYKWSLEDFCHSDEEFEQKYNLVSELIKQGKEFEGKLGDKSMLLKMLKFEEKVESTFEPIYFYCLNMLNVDLSNSIFQEKLARCEILATNYSKIMSYVEPELCALPEKYLDEIIADKNFKNYDYAMRTIKKHKKHSPSKQEAKLLSAINFVDFESNHSLFCDSGLQYPDAKDKNGKKHKVDAISRQVLLRSKDSVLRKNTMLSTMNAFKQYVDFLSNNYLCEVKKDVFDAKAHKYNSVIQFFLDGEDVSTKIYDMLTRKVNENIPLINRYFEIRKQLLGQKSINIYDFYLPISKVNEKHYDYDQAYEIVEKSLGVLGKEYVEVLHKAKEERWIDVMPSQNKISGAYSNSIYGYKPIALLNFIGDYQSLTTIAHEMGHSMHSYLSNAHQCREKAQYPIFLAEIASTTNELLLNNYMLSNFDKNDKLGLYDELLSEIYATIFRQMMFSEFEKTIFEEVEQEKSVDKEKLCDTYFTLCKKYLRKVKVLPQMRYEWARIPHFYMGFYVYKYAIGMICALNFSNRILSGEPSAREKYLKFLSSGGSREPNEILKDADCDLEKEETYDKAFDLLKKFISDYENLAKGKNKK